MDCTSERLKELFSRFGQVEDVVISSSKKKHSALVQMVAAMGTVSGNLSNPLLVVPFKLATGTKLSSVQQSTESGCQNNLGGTGYKAYVLEKFQKAAAAKNQKLICGSILMLNDALVPVSSHGQM
ncbi:hypothetical protein P3X46_006501 [Hevea brasiliensis]|uniref:RRM domain-containing protein n=1 Tax=Hevea brasiliensis TaxID=3981 RepID=A0ABQ9MUA1_HEVBR|nr:hypothetical protein P3X46_006501 [Hevea brasiliensis]